MIERDRLTALIEYVEATERDRLRTVSDMADYRAFRRSGEDIILLPGVLVNVRDGDDHRWLSVDRLVRRPPPVPSDPELRRWIDLRDDVAQVPSLRRELPREMLDDALRDGIETSGLALIDHPEAARLNAALEGYKREIWSAWRWRNGPAAKRSTCTTAFSRFVRRWTAGRSSRSN